MFFFLLFIFVYFSSLFLNGKILLFASFTFLCRFSFLCVFCTETEKYLKCSSIQKWHLIISLWPNIKKNFIHFRFHGMWAGAKIVWCEPNNHFRFYCTIAQGDNNNNNSANDFFYFFPSRFVGFVECFNSSVVECFCHPCTFHFVFMSHERKKKQKAAPSNHCGFL